MMIIVFILGLCFGSFIYTYAQRFCEKKGLLKLYSFCFECEKNLKFYHIIPLFSYCILKAKCPFCKTKLSFNFVFMELLAANLWSLAFINTQSFYEFLCLALILSTLMLLSLIDFKLKAVPSFLLFFLIFLCFLYAFDKQEFESLFIYQELSGGFLLYFFIFTGFIFVLKNCIDLVFFYKKQESMGEADILLIGTLAGILGFKQAFLMIFIAAFLALIFYFTLKIKAKTEPQIPMIPFLSLAFVFVFFGAKI